MKLNSISSETSFLEPKPKEIIWFPIRNRKEVNAIIARLSSEHVHTLRVGINCAEFNTKKGQKWYDWLLPTLAENFDLELCFDNYSQTPDRSLVRNRGLAEIVEHFIHRHGKCFTTVELWRNHSASGQKGSSENIFADDVVFTATWAKHLGKKVVLGKIRTEDFEWISKLVSSQFLKGIARVEIDKDGENLWSAGTGFYERTLRGLFEAKGLKTQVRPGAETLLNLQISNDNIAC